MWITFSGRTFIRDMRVKDTRDEMPLILTTVSITEEIVFGSMQYAMECCNKWSNNQIVEAGVSTTIHYHRIASAPEPNALTKLLIRILCIAIFCFSG